MTYEVMTFGELGERVNLHLTSSQALMCPKKKIAEAVSFNQLILNCSLRLIL